MKKITIDTIGDMVFRKWRAMGSYEKCPHCKKDINIELKFTNASFENVSAAIDLYERTWLDHFMNVHTNDRNEEAP